jgi:hypothetical protein
LTRRPLTAAQTAALDHDGDGKAGGSLSAATRQDLAKLAAENAAEAGAQEPADETDPDAPAADAPPADVNDRGDAGEPAAAEPAPAPQPAPEGAEAAVPAPEPQPDDAVGRVGSGGPEGPTTAAQENQTAAQQSAPPLAEAEAAIAPLAEPAPTTTPVLADPTVRDEQIAFLGDLTANRYGLYRHAGGGYGGEAHRPRWSQAFADQAVELGLAHHEPSGGAHGSVKITDVGRAAYKRLRQDADAAAAEAG